MTSPQPLASNSNYSFKVSVIGCGNVGATIAYALLLDGATTELSLIDVEKEKVRGLLLDLEHSLAFTAFTKIKASDDYSICQDSDLIIITAGRRQKPGQTRLELVEGNRQIYSQIISNIIKYAPHSLLLIVSNPVDVMTSEAIKLANFRKGQIFGSGTILDTARFQFHLSEKLKIHPRSIDAYILGEHGDSSFPVLSSANVVGKRLLDFEGFNLQIAEQCYQEAKNAAYRIINDLGFTCYSIATAVREIVKSIVEDSQQVFMLSTLLQNYYGHSDVCLSVPCVLGRNGIEKPIEIPLDQKEQQQLAKSVQILKSFQG